MLGCDMTQRAAYSPLTCSSPSGSSRQVRPVSVVGTSSGPGVQSTGSPIGWPNSFSRVTRHTLDRRPPPAA